MTDLDDLVAEYVEIADQIDALTRQLDDLRAQLRDLGVGRHPTSSGLVVTVSAPSRRFDLQRAWALLTPEQQAVCVSPDPRKTKAQLPPVLLEECMAPGTGHLMVKIQ